MIKSVKVVRRNSEKSGKDYSAVEFDLGYRKVMWFAGDSTCAELLGKSVAEFLTCPVPAEFDLAENYDI